MRIFFFFFFCIYKISIFQKTYSILPLFSHTVYTQTHIFGQNINNYKVLPNIGNTISFFNQILILCFIIISLIKYCC